MDKSTLSNYGWIVIAVLVLAVMIALATPFGSYIEQGVRSTTQGLFDTSEKALNVVGMSAGEGSFGGSGETSTTNLPAKGKTLKEYTWAEVHQIIQAGKATEYGFAVGSTKTLQINGATKTAIIIGLDHDGANTATFMIADSGGIGYRYMNPYDEELGYGTNEGGWKDSAMREWLNTDIYNSMTDVKDYIKPVTKMTNNTGYQGTTVTATTDTLFILSPKEAGVADYIDNWSSYPEECKSVLETEGTVYEWFNNGSHDDSFWLRSPFSNNSNKFFYYFCGLGSETANSDAAVKPAFVIG